MNIDCNNTTIVVEEKVINVTLSGGRGPQGPEGLPGPVGPQPDVTWGSITGALEEQIDLQNALNDKLPYTGATQDVNLGEFGLLTGNVEFDLTPTNVPTAAGSMYYIDTDGTLGLVLKGGNVISRVGETQHVRVYNNTGSPIAKGKVVAISGSQGQRPTIILADADSEALSKDTIGFTAEAIANNAQGFVMIAGMLTNVNTSGMTDGATVYLSTTAGEYTTTQPADPAHLVILGFIVNGGSVGAGSIYVKVDNGYEIQELHNVSINGLADEDLLSYESASLLWKNKPRRYQQTFTSGTSFNVTFATIKFQPNSVRVYKPTGEEVSVVTTISDKVYIQSNVNLLDHVLKIT
jgi:hypothetical protein